MAASVASPSSDLILQYKTTKQNNSSQGQWRFSAEDKNKNKVTTQWDVWNNRAQQSETRKFVSIA